MSQQGKYRFLFAGGGTGGHIFPAIAVAEKIKMLKPESDILFIGTKNKIESEVVPKAGFKFKSIWIKGFARKFNIQNLLFPLKLAVSLLQSIYINLRFKPAVAVGSGGYVSGPAVWGASFLGAKIILLEQNSYPGITTRMLEKKADEIHISFEESKKYLRMKDKLFVTGNPVRADFQLMDKNEASIKFNLDANKRTVLVLGGSLGAGNINSVMMDCLPALIKENVQVIWQTGKDYYESYKNLSSDGVVIRSFIDDMKAAFSACTVAISRAGATTIAEITNMGIPTIFVPSPNVAANHQYHNARALADARAAILLKDDEIKNNLLDAILNLIFNDLELTTLKENIKNFAKPDSAYVIAKRAIALAEMN